MKFSDKQILTLGDDLKRAGYDYQARLDILRAVNSHEELLEACKEAYDTLRNGKHEGQYAHSLLKKAIAKAEGK